jgi:ATP/ADP translocase
VQPGAVTYGSRTVRRVRDEYFDQTTSRQALFLPVSREAKYKAKAAIDAVFMRFGDVLEAGLT